MQCEEFCIQSTQRHGPSRLGLSIILMHGKKAEMKFELGSGYVGFTTHASCSLYYIYPIFNHIMQPCLCTRATQLPDLSFIVTASFDRTAPTHPRVIFHSNRKRVAHPSAVCVCVTCLPTNNVPRRFVSPACLQAPPMHLRPQQKLNLPVGCPPYTSCEYSLLYSSACLMRAI